MSDTLTKPGSKKSKEKFSVKVKVKSGRARKSDGGLFRYWVSGSRGKNAAWEFSPDQLIEVIRIGVPVQELRVLQASLGVPMEQLVPMLGIRKQPSIAGWLAESLDQPNPNASCVSPG